MKRAILLSAIALAVLGGSTVVAQRVGPNLLPKELFGAIGQAVGEYQKTIKDRVNAPAGPTLTDKELYDLSARVKEFEQALGKMEPQKGPLEMPKELDDFGKTVLTSALVCDDCGEMKPYGRVKALPRDISELNSLLLERCALLQREIGAVLKSGHPISRSALSRIQAYLFYMQSITIWYGHLDSP
jgi:hypothetical protein